MEVDMTDKVLSEIIELGIDREVAVQMIETFEKCGGLACLMQWPNQFSWFSGERNVLDVPLANNEVL
jgi:hypothetical protein